MADNELSNAGPLKAFLFRHAPAKVQEWMQDRELVERITTQFEQDARNDRKTPAWDATTGTFGKPDERPDVRKGDQEGQRDFGDLTTGFHYIGANDHPPGWGFAMDQNQPDTVEWKDDLEARVRGVDQSLQNDEEIGLER